MGRHILALATTMLVAGWSSQPLAATPSGEVIAHQGDGSAPACTGCHGPAFQGNPAIKAPALAGLASSFILARLAHYASPAGHNPTMRAVAQALTPADRQAVAQYLSTLPKAPN